MVTYVFRPQAAIDQNGTLVVAGSGQVFDPTDTGFATPLTVQNSAGVNVTSIAVSTIGQTERFSVVDKPHLVWKSGQYVVDIWSLDGMVAAVDASKAAAAASASAAAATLTSAEALLAETSTFRRWMELGVTRRNFVRDPKGSNLARWRISGGETLTVVTDGGQPALEAVDPLGAGSIYSDPIHSWAREDDPTNGLTPIPGLRAGKWLAFGVDVKALDAATAAGTSLMRFGFYNGAVIDGTSAGATTPVSTTGYTRITRAMRVLDLPDGAYIRTLLWPGGGVLTPAGGGFRHRNWVVSVGDTQAEALAAVTSYWDGDTPAETRRGYRWSGTANDSVSEMIDMSIIAPEGVTADWANITNKPGVFPPASHTHDPATAFSGTGLIPISRIASGTPTGTKFVRDDGTLAEPPGTGGGSGSGIVGAPSTWPTSFPPAAHTHPATQISDASSVGRGVITAVDAATARAQIGAGTSSVTVGGVLTGAAAPASHTHPPAQVGLGNVANVAPADLPVSAATAQALDGKAPLSHTHPQSQISGLVAALDARIQAVRVVTGSEPRPTGSAIVLWIGGSTQPASMASVDAWLKEV